MTGPRDWDKEMAEIDKLLAKGPEPASPAPATPATRDARPAAPAALQARPAPGPVATRRVHIAGVWVRALIGLAGAATLPFWPYPKGCGTMLYLYLAATFVVAAIGAWTMRYSWTHRRGVAHVAGLLAMVAGLGFAAIEILQRTHLAAAQLSWTCP